MIKYLVFPKIELKKFMGSFMMPDLLDQARYIWRTIHIKEKIILHISGCDTTFLLASTQRERALLLVISYMLLALNIIRV